MEIFCENVREKLKNRENVCFFGRFIKLVYSSIINIYSMSHKSTIRKLILAYLVYAKYFIMAIHLLILIILIGIINSVMYCKLKCLDYIICIFPCQLYKTG